MSGVNAHNERQGRRAGRLGAVWHVRVPPAVLAQWKRVANLYGLTVGAWVRQTCMREARRALRAEGVPVSELELELERIERELERTDNNEGDTE